MNTEFSARKGVQVLLWVAEGARSTPLSSDLSKRSRTSEEHRDGRVLGGFLRAPGEGQGAMAPRRSGATQWSPERRRTGRRFLGDSDLCRAGRLREPVVCAGTLGDTAGSAPSCPRSTPATRGAVHGVSPAVPGGARPLTADQAAPLPGCGVTRLL